MFLMYGHDHRNLGASFVLIPLPSGLVLHFCMLYDVQPPAPKPATFPSGKAFVFFFLIHKYDDV